MDQSDFWLKKWEVGDIRFHQSQFHPQLVKHAGRFTAGTIMVPLCGKSLDMIYLESQGHKVVGAELSPIACRDFFVENKIPYQEKNVSGFNVFASEKITLWCGDFFQLPPEAWQGVTGVYDRAALIALPEEVRKEYTAEILRRSPVGVQILLITVEYEESVFQGPPFSVRESEIQRLYPSHQVECLHRQVEQRQMAEKTLEMSELVYWIQ